MTNIDLTFLGEQIKRLQSDVRQVRAEQLRQEVELAEGLTALEQQIDSLEKSIDAQFAQVNQTMATNLEIMLTAIGAKAGK